MRKFLAGAALALLIIGGYSAAGQTDSTIVCGQLSADDCAILQASQTASAGLTAENFTFDGSVTLDDVTDLPAGEHVFTLDGSGTIVGDMTAFNSAAMNNTAAMTDPTAQLDVVRAALNSIDARLDLTIGLPATLFPDSSAPESISLNLLLIEGVGYLNFDTLIALEPSLADFLPSGYAGLDLINTIDSLYPLMMQPGMSAGDMGLDAQTLQTLSDPAFIGQYTIYTREADTTNEAGETVAVFTTTIDFAGLVRDPAYVDLLRQTAEAQGESIDEAELQQALDGITAFTDAVDYRLTTEIGTADNFVRSIETEIVIDLNTFNSAAVEMGGMDQDLNGTVTVLFDIDYTDFNTATTPIVPDGAPVVTFNQLSMFLFGSSAPMMEMTAEATVEATAEATAEATEETGIAVPTVVVPTVVVPTVVVPTVVVPTVVVPTVIVPTVIVSTVNPPGTPEATEEPIVPGPTPSPTVAS